MVTSENEMIRQWLDSHWGEFCDWWASKTKDASEIERVTYDSERHNGVLMVLNYQGVRKVVSVTPDSLIEGLSSITEELIQRCTDATVAAEAAAELANTQAGYAETQADRVDALITQVNNLMVTVAAQGDAAEAKGNAAETLKNTVESWYTPFKTAAENWLTEKQTLWNTWYTNTILPAWNEFWGRAQSDHQTWSDAEAQRIINETERQQKEQERREAGFYRQNEETGNWDHQDQRSGEWADTGHSWQGGMIAYRFRTDWRTGRGKIVKNMVDHVNFSIRRGRLIATYNE